MTDSELVLKKLSFLETCVREIRDHGERDRLETDLVQRRFLEHTLQVAIQAALDAASHILSDQRLGEPRTNKEMFDLLARNGWLPLPLARTMRFAAGFRNVLVRGGQDVDLTGLKEIVEKQLDDLLGFAQAVRERVEAS